MLRCGKPLCPESLGRVTWQSPVIPTTARYNERVKGDSLRSTVQVNAIYLADEATCVSRGKWETQFEQAIKIRSERPR
jgi:hypothetical protein